MNDLPNAGFKLEQIEIFIRQVVPLMDGSKP